MITLRRAGLGAWGLLVAVLLAGVSAGSATVWQPAAVAASIGLALLLRTVPALRTYQYTAWIIAAVVAAMVYPSAFLRWGDFDLRNKWVILVVVQTVMFGMGTQMSLKDFVGVMKMPWGVIVAVGCQFLIMPLTGFALTRLFPLPDEIAAGVILIGCCSSGLASNVMCFIARANLALSITATAVATLLAPLMTPLWMKLLAGRLVEIQFVAMMSEIIKIVIVPIAAAMLHDHLKHATPAGRRCWVIAAGIGAAWLLFLAVGGWSRLTNGAEPTVRLAYELASFAVGAVVFGVVYHAIATRRPAIDRVMPLMSMAGIVYFTTITTAAGRDNLLQVGSLLFIAAILHNTAGYVFGYGLARAARLDRPSARAVAIEVGLQNGGMASGLAGAMGRLGTVGLAAAVFSPWMNVSGSLLANFWRRRPVEAGAGKR
jgi:bile acid:Na+ symporter, BASS family